MELGEVFLANGVEFKVTFINEKNKRFSAEPVDGKSMIPVGERFNFENKWYLVVYIHTTKKRITFEERT